MQDRFDSVLVVDDNEDVLASLELLLKPHCGHVVTETDPSRIPQHLSTGPFDAILLDMNFTRDTTSGREGFEWLGTILERDPESRVVVLTGHGDVEMAVNAIKKGAADFVLKPWDNDRLLRTLSSARRRGFPMKSGKTGDSQQMRQELLFAREVQERLFPHDPPTLKTLDYWGACRTAMETGGDYYDFIALGPGLLGFALGDVSGKGVSAALLMASLQGRLQSVAPLRRKLVSQLVSEINDSMCTATDPNKYVTLFYGVYDDVARTLTYVNAGHHPPFLICAGGRDSVRRLTQGGTVLGLFPEASFEQETVQLEPGDIVVIFTDGVIEARSRSDEEFGEPRLVRHFLRGLESPPRDLLQQTLEELERYCDGAPPHDDLTLVIGRVR